MIRILGGLTALLLVVGGCATAGAPSGSPAGGASTGASAASGTPVAATTATQTQIEWGRIWDALPPSFPHYPGAEPTQIGAGPASAVLTVPADARTAAGWYAMALKAAGFPTVGANGPLEDGSFVVDSSGATTGCVAQTTLAPLGTTTTATIYVAAACPFS